MFDAAATSDRGMILGRMNGTVEQLMPVVWGNGEGLREQGSKGEGQLLTRRWFD